MATEAGPSVLCFSVLLILLLCLTHQVTAVTRIKRGDGNIGSRLNVNNVLGDVDVNSDGVVDRAEYINFINTFDANSDGNISRCEWTSRTVDVYDGSKLGSLNYFDLLDVTEDNVLAQDDLQLLRYDEDENGTVTSEEFKSGLEKDTGQSTESDAYKNFAKLSDIKVPSEKIKSTLNIQLMTADVDVDKDGVVTRPELQQFYIVSFDVDGDYKVTRCEYVTGSEVRYGDRKEVASASFDGHDINNNNYIDVDDLKLRRFDQNGDMKLTTEEFSAAVKQADWLALKSVFPTATTPAPPNPAGSGSQRNVAGMGVVMAICVYSVLHLVL